MTPVKCFMIELTGGASPEGHPLYRRADTGEVDCFLNPAPKQTPIGAMWFCPWLTRHPWVRTPKHYFPDENGQILAVMTPGGIWILDSRANNCTKPNDDEHRCWIRHGTPPMVHVDKVGGPTCDAGAGSIQAGSWHGWLTNGHLQEER